MEYTGDGGGEVILKPKFVLDHYSHSRNITPKKNHVRPLAHKLLVLAISLQNHIETHKRLRSLNKRLK